MKYAWNLTQRMRTSDSSSLQFLVWCFWCFFLARSLLSLSLHLAASSSAHQRTIYEVRVSRHQGYTYHLVVGKCCGCSLCASTLSWSDCTPGYLFLRHGTGFSSVVAGLYSVVPITCFLAPS